MVKMIDIKEAKAYLDQYNGQAKYDMYNLHYHLGLHYLVKYPYRKFENEFHYLLNDVLQFGGTYKIYDDVDNLRKSKPKILGV